MKVFFEIVLNFLLNFSILSTLLNISILLSNSCWAILTQFPLCQIAHQRLESSLENDNHQFVIHNLNVDTFDILFFCTILKYIIVSNPAIPRHIINIITSISWVTSELSSKLVRGRDFELRELLPLLELMELRANCCNFFNI